MKSFVIPDKNESKTKYALVGVNYDYNNVNELYQFWIC